MRKVLQPQMKFGEVDISDIKFDLRSRDEIPQLLMGLQYIYCNPELRNQVFAILEKEVVPTTVAKDNGRPGMELWKLLVLGTLRLNCNWDYDKLQEIANNHHTLRQMLGHGELDKDYYYPLQTLKDNVSLLTVKALEEINRVVVGAGHQLLGKKNGGDIELRGRCDSFVVETNVHYPTDINLLYDAIRKVIMLVTAACLRAGRTWWRQGHHQLRQVKKSFNAVRKLRHSTSQHEAKKEEQAARLVQVHQSYLKKASALLIRAESTVEMLRMEQLAAEKELVEIEKFIDYGLKQINLIERRVVKGEVIPHGEKLFSLFEPHTEWISKGKAGVPQELGLRVGILEDQYGFILHHQVMTKLTDDKVAVGMVRTTKSWYPRLTGCSFDKGYWSPGNLAELKELLEFVVLCKKGKLSPADQERECSEAFIHARQQHPAVESGINALENHGLDRCPDHGLEGFTRYVALAVVGRNLQKLGNLLRHRAVARLKWCRHFHETLTLKRLDAA